MEFHYHRKLKFKAWNTAARLLVRLHTIDCVRGELVKDDHILLQFTNLHDKHGEEIYDRDVLLIDNTRYTIYWDDAFNTWALHAVDKPVMQARNEIVMHTVRLRSFFETP